MSAETSRRLKTKADGFPAKPGIYFFRDANGRVVYIGKARSLRHRVRSYFLPTADMKVRGILAETEDIDFILTGSEKEASFLENNFVRQCQPKFNLRLKDDKHFPYLKLTCREPFPGIALTRRVEDDGARYFGPFSPAVQARQTIHLITRFFGVRSCREEVPGKRKRPCLEFDLNLCSAPCVGRISRQEYAERVENALLLLEGKIEVLKPRIRTKMEEASRSHLFEQAAHWRNLLQALEQIREKPRFISVGQENKDIIGYARLSRSATVDIFLMRDGKVVESESFHLDDCGARSDGEILFQQVRMFYSARPDVPDQILLPFAPSRPAELNEFLSASRGRKVDVLVPRRGRNKRLLDFANTNAEILLRNRKATARPVEELQAALGLDSPPLRIEGFDISNTGGEETVGSLVAFAAGVPDSGEYRKYRVMTVRGPNDVAGLSEVIRRRYSRRLEEGAELPDLILVDGGKAQLSAARSALDGLGLNAVPLVALAKKEEIIFLSGRREGLRLDRTSPALKLLQNIRDEAHRFAISFHRRRREKRSFASELDAIPGIGPRRRNALLRRFKSLDGIRRAGREDLAPIVGLKAARDLKAYLEKKTGKTASGN